jgi:arabinose-5-phosphate isomerase
LSSVNKKPKVSPDTNIKDVIIEITEKMLGVTAVVDQDNIVGIITDGDLRRMLSKVNDFSKLSAKDILGVNPRSVDIETMAIDALEIMESNEITQLLVEEEGKYAGIVHLHD